MCGAEHVRLSKQSYSAVQDAWIGICGSLLPEQLQLPTSSPDRLSHCHPTACFSSSLFLLRLDALRCTTPVLVLPENSCSLPFSGHSTMEMHPGIWGESTSFSPTTWKAFPWEMEWGVSEAAPHLSENIPSLIKSFIKSLWPPLSILPAHFKRKLRYSATWKQELGELTEYTIIIRQLQILLYSSPVIRDALPPILTQLH